MTTSIITDQGVEHRYIATAGQTVFPFDFQIFNGASDIYLTVNEVPTTAFWVDLVGDEGGTVTLDVPTALDDEVVLRRVLPFERLTQFPASGPLAVAALNEEMNRLIALVQQINYNLADLDDALTYGDADARGAVLGYLEAGEGISLTPDGDKLTVASTLNFFSTLQGLLQAGAGVEFTVNAGKLIIGMTGEVGGGLTTEDVRDTVAAALVAGSGIAVVHDDVANTITLTATGAYTDEQARDAIGTALVAGAGLTKTVNDAGDTITLAADPARVLQLPVMAAAMTPRGINGAGFSTTETSTNQIALPCLDFDQSTIETAQFLVPMPKQWNRGTVTMQFLWTVTTGTGSVVWGVRGVAFGDDDALDAAFGSYQEVIDTVTSAGDLMISSFTGAVTIAGSPQSEDMVCFEVKREAVSGADTLAADARLIGVRLKLTVNALDDA